MLLLGEADFSFAYDLARFLFLDVGGVAQANTAFQNSFSVNKLTATGFDTAEEVKEKYKDSVFLINNMLQLTQKTKRKRSNLDISVKHGVNAISPLNEDDPPGLNSPEAATYVIFNHPHLGIEDARRHSQFLSHLFHSVRNRWMVKKGAFFLTLAAGQWERWRGLEAAEKCGFSLLNRCPFEVPGERQHEWKPYYQQRRHQTGKSFPGRSEIFTFCDVKERDFHKQEGIIRPFWCANPKKRLRTTPLNNTQYVCKICNKTFAERRSLKNHALSKHSGGEIENEVLKENFQCPDCPRKFESITALNDHRNATHAALHRKIHPDWWSEQEKPTCVPASNQKIQPGGSCACSICGASLDSSTSVAEHLTLFAPESVSELSLYQCGFCGKNFREDRAKLQHENFCKSRLSDASPI